MTLLGIGAGAGIVGFVVWAYEKASGRLEEFARRK